MSDKEDRCAACGHERSKHDVYHCIAWYDNDTPCNCEEFATLVKPDLDKLDPNGWEYHDNINHPSHYTQYKGIEVIDLTEQMNFNKGNAVKYICRAGFKSPESHVEDLKKARWYIDREIQRLEKE